MGKQFSLPCEECGHENDFSVHEVDGLNEHIWMTETDAAMQVERKYEDHFHPDEFLGGECLLFELALAIRRGDRFEAELYLDRLAADIGPPATEEVQRGRYSPQARRVA